MSEFIAEAQVLITPNVALFAATLKKQLEAAVLAAGPVVIPVAATSTAPLVAATEAATTATLGLSAATGLEAESLDLASAAQLKAAAAAEAAGAAAAAEAAQLALLTAAQDAGVLAFKRSEAVATAAVGTTSELAAARATLRAATAATVANEIAFDAALAANNRLLQISAADALLEARALEASAKAAFGSAVAHKADARATAEAAAFHAQATKGLAAETLALTGLRGATLAASAPFLIGATSAIVFIKSIKAASDETEQLNKSVEVFTSSAPEIEEWASTTATSIGISKTAALGAASTFGELFRTLGVGPAKAAALSETLVELGSDLASFNNVSTDRALQAIQSGLVGQARPLRALGVFLTEARVKQEALTETGKKFASGLTQQEKILARESLILRDAAIASGDFERTQGRLANQGRILSAQLEDIAAGIGSKLVPVLTGAAITTNKVLEGVQKLAKAKITPGGPDVTSLLGWVGGWKEVAFVWDHSIFPGLLKMDDGITGLTLLMKGANKAALDLAKALAKVGDANPPASAAQQSDLALSLARSSGDQAGELAELQKRAAKQEDFLNEQLGKFQTSKRVALEKKASDNLAQTNADIQRILDERATDAEKAAQDQKDALEKAAQAQKKAVDAVIAQFTGRSDALGFALQRASSNDNFKKQIAINKAIISNDQKEIAALKARINHLHLHGEALKAAQAAIQAANREITQARDAIADARAARKQALDDRKQALVNARQSHLEALLAIAETTKSKADDRAREKALIAFDQVQIRRILAIKRRRKLTLEEAAQLDSYRVDLAQRNQALRELAEESKKGSSAFFTFLQTQSGFTANLLGNLIPGFATRGLVGGGSSAGPAAGAAFSDLGASPGKGVQQTAAIGASQAAGVKPVQVDTTNQLLRQILAAVQGRGRPAPETVHNRRVGSAMMDTLGGIHGA